MTYFIVAPSLRLRRRDWTISAAIFCLGYAVLSAGMAAAQVVNPTRLAPTVQPSQGEGVGVSVQAADGELRAPANADKIFLTVRGVKVDGAFPELAEQTAALIGEIQGRRVSLAKIYEFATALHLAYLNAGYLLARVTIPQQNIRGDAIIRIVVIDGFFEDIDLSAVPERARDLVRARLEPLIGKRHVTQAELQRGVLLIGDIAGVTGGSTIRAGSAGGTILVIQATEKLVSAVTATTNRLPKELGTWAFTQAVDVNNALGWGEQFSANVSSSPDNRFFDGTSRFMSYGGSVLVPIGSDGLRAEAGYVSVRQRPTHVFGTFPIDQEFAGERLASRYERAYVQAIYPIILTLEQTLRVQGIYNHTTSVFRQGPFPSAVLLPGDQLPVGLVSDLFNDRYDAVRLAGDWTRQFPWAWGGSATTTAIYSHGLGGRTVWDSLLVPPLSRPGASPKFNKFYVSAEISQPLPEGFQVSLVARAQTSFGAPLMLSEQLSLDGANAVSGFAAGTLNVDRGVTVRSELSYPWTVQNGVAVPYIFGAWGRGLHEWWPYIGALKTIEAESLGGGLRTNTSVAGELTGLPLSESFNVEFAKDFTNIPFKRSGYRTNFGFAVRF